MTQSLNIGIGGAWRSAKPYVGVGGVWKRVLYGYVGVGGVWKQFFAAFSATLNIIEWFPNPVGADPFTGDPIYDGYAGGASVVVSNGSGSYAYAWSVVSGNAQTHNATNFSACDFRSPDATPSTVACQVTDTVTGLVTIGTGVIG